MISHIFVFMFRKAYIPSTHSFCNKPSDKVTDLRYSYLGSFIRSKALSAGDNVDKIFLTT